LSFIACSLPRPTSALSARTLEVYDIFALEMFPLVEVHEEKRLKDGASSVYFAERGEAGTMNKERESEFRIQKSEENLREPFY
jgi:hypothetical protein